MKPHGFRHNLVFVYFKYQLREFEYIQLDISTSRFRHSLSTYRWLPFFLSRVSAVIAHVYVATKWFSEPYDSKTLHETSVYVRVCTVLSLPKSVGGEE